MGLMSAGLTVDTSVAADRRDDPRWMAHDRRCNANIYRGVSQGVGGSEGAVRERHGCRELWTPGSNSGSVANFLSGRTKPETPVYPILLVNRTAGLDTV